MSVPLLISAVGCLAFFVAGLVIGPRVWRNEWRSWAYHPDRVPAWWPHGGPLWRGWIRLVPLAWAMFGLAGVAALLLSARTGILHALGLIAGALLMLVLLLGVPVVLFNRPRFVVLPHFRQLPGAIAE